jgi:signal transduction histidine kinase
VRPTTEAETLLGLLDELVDGVLFVDADGRILRASRAFRRSAEVLGLSLDGAFVDRLLELADRTSEPYAFTAAVERLQADAGSLEFEDAALGGVYELRVSPVDTAGRLWTLRDLTEERRADRVRYDRVATLGHELRTPLTSMTGFIELLEDGGAGPLTPEQARYLEIVRRAAERLQGLVGDLLDDNVREAG